MKPGIGNFLSFLAVAVVAVPANAFEEPAAPNRTITDISLTANGELLGAIVNKNGQPLVANPVQVFSQQKLVVAAKTDSNGRYRIKGLRTGLHVIRIAGKDQACRLWTAKTAPPTAKRGLVTANDGTIVRGQSDDDYYELGSPQILGLAVFGGATAATLISTLGADDDDTLGGASGDGSGSGGGGDPASP